MSISRKTKSGGVTRRRQRDVIQTAADFGIDVSMLIENTKRTPAERIRRHQIALNTAEKLRKAKRI